MKKFWAILVLVVLALALGFWLKRPGAHAPSTTTTPLAVAENQAGKAGDVQVTEEAMKLAEIQVAPATLRNVQDRLNVSGAVQSGGDQIAKITPKVTGKVVQLLVQVGDSGEH